MTASISYRDLSNEHCLAASEAKWYAVHTYPQNEKKVETELQRRGIATFLPLRSELHRWSDRTKVVQVPLFPCYAFVRIAASPALRRAIVQTPRVIRFLPDNNEPLAVPDAEIESIRTLLKSDVPFSPFAARAAIGQRVRIRGGCLHGVEGTLVDCGGGRKCVVSINLIREAVAVTLDGYAIEPA